MKKKQVKPVSYSYELIGIDIPDGVDIVRREEDDVTRWYATNRTDEDQTIKVRIEGTVQKPPRSER